MEARLNIFKHALAVWYCATIYGSDMYMFVSKPRVIIMSWRESKITISYKMFLAGFPRPLPLLSF